MNFKGVKIWLYLAIIISLPGCGKGDKDNILPSITNYLNSHNDTTLLVSSFTNFKWDHMYVFNEGTSQSEVNKVLKTEYKDYEELSMIIVFTKGKEIVHKETYPYDPEVPTINTWFQFDNTFYHYMVFEKSDDGFKVNKEVIDGKNFYTLIGTKKEFWNED